MKNFFVLLVTTVVLALPSLAHADADSRALAVQLFDEAERLFESKQVAQACPKYAESYRLDPQLGVLIYLAECYEKNAQLASAWGSFREAEELAQRRGDQRGDHARERAAALEPRLSYLVIQVPTSARLTGLEILRDGAPVARVMWDARAAIDGGTHRIIARAPGYKPWSKTVTLSAETSTVTVAVPKLEVDLTKGADTAAASGSSQRIGAIAVGGLGVVGIVAAGFFGLSAQGTLSDAEPLCNERNYCTRKGDELRRSSRGKATIATLSAGVGAAALGAAAVLWFTSPKGDRSRESHGAQPRWAVAPANSGLGMEMSHAF